MKRKKKKKRLHGLELQIVEYKSEIPRASLRQIVETFTASFMSYRPANVPVFFGKKPTLYDIFRKNTTIVLSKIGNYVFQHGPNIEQWK